MDDSAQTINYKMTFQMQAFCWPGLNPTCTSHLKKKLFRRNQNMSLHLKQQLNLKDLTAYL